MGFLTAQSTINSAVASIIGLINLLIYVLAALALVVFFIGLVRYIYDAGSSKGHAEGIERIQWSLIALFVLFSIWGILGLMNSAFFGTSTYSASSYDNTTTTGGPSVGQPMNISPSYYNSTSGN